MSTFVLLPGAGGAAWYWSRVVPLLERAGHEVIAVDLPGEDPSAGLAEYAELVVSAIGDRTDVVLVAQSMGGFTAPLVCAATPVSLLVLVNAMIPVPGETPNEWGENTKAGEAREAAAEAAGYGEFEVESYFFHDVSPEIFAEAAAHEHDEAESVFDSVCDFTSWPPVPIRVLCGADDRLFPVDFQQRVARERLGVDADVLPGGHLIALAQPEAVADYLLRT